MRVRYPVILHTDDGRTYGVTIPDLPGCFTCGESKAEALARIQEAVEAHLWGDDEAPAPSPIEAVQSLPEAEDGALEQVEVDLGFLDRSAAG